MCNDKTSPKPKSAFRRTALASVAMIMMVCAPLANAQNIFVNIEGIKGASQRDQFQGAIEAESWQWGMANTSSGIQGSRTSTGTASFDQLTFVHMVDQASPVLMRYCASGRALREARLSLVATVRDRPNLVFEIILQNVIVSKIVASGDRSGGAPMEEVSLSFSAVTAEYTPFRSDGTKTEPIRFGWDLAKNIPK